MTDAHLLLVDNDPQSMDTLAGYFRNEKGITFHTAGNAAEAWAILQDQAEQFDLMILDCLMPQRGGLDLPQRIRADQRLTGIPLILQTPTPPTAEQLRTGAAAGAYHYLRL